MRGGTGSFGLALKICRLVTIAHERANTNIAIPKQAKRPMRHNNSKYAKGSSLVN